MEALTALSVASSVIQFVDFGSKLLARSRQLYKAPGGALSENVDVEILTHDLQTLLLGLRRRLPENRSLKSRDESRKYSEDDEALDTLCKKCVEIAEELLRRLEKLKVKDKNIKKGDNVDDDEPSLVPVAQNFKRLNGALQDLAIQQSKTSHQLAQSTRLILDTFLSSRDGLATQLQIQSEKLIASASNNKLNEAREDQRIENILRGELGPVGSLEPAKDRKQPAVHNSEKSAKELQVEEEIRLLMIENGILGSLAFSALTDRRESVEVAYRQTFEWIYEDSTVPGKPWSNLIDWLRHGNGIYWVNGKAGSGKSTLMRYIYDHHKTREAFQEWAGPTPCGISSFFFWNSGDLEQRSQSGLLRSLLLEILQRHRDLLPEIMPDIWDTWATRVSCIMSMKLSPNSPLLPPEPKPWMLLQLKSLFRTLLRAIRNQVKLFLLIDGLDEYDGDCEEIVDLFQDFTNFPNIKLCVSSRPLVVFERGFANFPSLKLQNLTYGDISHYVKDKLGSHTYMIQISQQHAYEVAQLIDEIVEKASGVFLWVKLVVKSLLHGLRDYNRISDLQRRVRHLPADLEALYAHMLGHTDPFYREQASQIFQIVRAAKKRSSERITLLNLSWADDEDLKLAENAPIRPISTQEIIMRCKMMDARLKSVCVGLLESTEVQFSDIAPDCKISFLHRTVSDFFAKEEVWNSLLVRTKGTGFNPNLSMLRSCVLQLKTLDISRNSGPLDMAVIVDALNYAKAAESDLNTGFPKLLDQLDVAASYQWRMRNSNDTDVVENLGTESTGSSINIMAKHFSSCRKSNVILHDPADDSYVRTGLEIDSPYDTDDTDDLHQLEYLDGLDIEMDDVVGGKQDVVGCLQSPRKVESPLMPAQLFHFEASPSRRTGKFLNEASLSLERHTIRAPGRIRSSGFRSPEIDRDARNLYHWSYGIEIPGIKPIGKARTFYQMTKDIGLSHYAAAKYESAIVIDQDVNQHLLMHAISSSCKSPGVKSTAPDPALVSKFLKRGADPNLSYGGITPWENAMTGAVSHFVSQNGYHSPDNSSAIVEWEHTAREWAKVFEVCIDHNADPNALGGGPQKLSPLSVVRRYFPDFLSQEASKLAMMLEERGGKQMPMLSNESSVDNMAPLLTLVHRQPPDFLSQEALEERGGEKMPLLNIEAIESPNDNVAEKRTSPPSSRLWMFHSFGFSSFKFW